MILQLQQEIKAEGAHVSPDKLCQCFGMPSRTAYHRPTKGKPKLQVKFVTTAKAVVAGAPHLATTRWVIPHISALTPARHYRPRCQRSGKHALRQARAARRGC